MKATDLTLKEEIIEIRNRINVLATKIGGNKDMFDVWEFLARANDELKSAQILSGKKERYK